MHQLTFASQAALKNATFKLKKLMIPFAQGTDCIQITEQLAPLVVEIMGGSPLQAIPTGIELTPVDVYEGSNPILAGLTKQKRLLVHLPREQKRQALIELLEESKGTQIRIIVANDNQSKDLKHELADKGINSSYLIDHGSDFPNSPKVRITSRNRVSSPLFALDTADLVVFYDANMLLDAESIPAEAFYSGKVYENKEYTAPKNDLSLLFQANFPTTIPSRTKVLALLSDELPLLEMKNLWCLLSIESLSLDAIRRPITTHRFRFVSFIHHELPVFDTDEPSSFQVRKQCIWSNPTRNLFISQVVKKLQGGTIKGELTKGQTALDRVPAIEGPANIIIIAENNIQLCKLHDFYSFKTASGDVSTSFVTLSTLSSLRIDNSNPCLILRIDGGVGELPSFNLAGEVFVLDVADKNKNLPYFANSIDQRRQAYCDLGWTESGRPRLESRWLGNQPKQDKKTHIVRRAR